MNEQERIKLLILEKESVKRMQEIQADFDLHRDRERYHIEMDKAVRDLLSAVGLEQAAGIFSTGIENEFWFSCYFGRSVWL